MPAFGPSGYEIARLFRLGSGANPILPGGKRGVHLNQQIELVVEHHLHQHTPQKLAALNVLGDTLGRLVEIVDFLPVLERGPLIISPELRSRVQRGQSISVLFWPRSAQSFARRLKYCAM
jgi:hypothetical protein